MNYGFGEFVKGDRVKVKIGNKIYSSKTKPGKSEQTVKIKPSKSGSKITVWVENKYKQVLSKKKSDIIYDGTKIRMGLTKAQVRLIVDWRYPDSKTHYPQGETWNYDMDNDGNIDKYVSFTNGRVAYWTY